MNPSTLPLHLSAAGIRLTGYVIERQLRVARVVAEAALQVNPLTLGAGTASRGALPRKADRGAAKGPRATQNSAAWHADPTPAAKAPAKAEKPARKPIVNATGPDDKPAKAPPAEPAETTAAPAAKPAAARAAAPAPTPAEGAESRAATPPQTPADTRTGDASEIVDAATSRRRKTRTPAAPPAMPERSSDPSGQATAKPAPAAARAAPADGTKARITKKTSTD